MEARRFPEPEVVGSIPTAGDLLPASGTWALSSVEERPFRIREVEGSNPSVSTFSLFPGKPTNVTSDGIEPPLSDLESEVLPLHHEANATLPPAGARRDSRGSAGNKSKCRGM